MKKTTTNKGDRFKQIKTVETTYAQKTTKYDTKVSDFNREEFQFETLENLNLKKSRIWKYLFSFYFEKTNKILNSECLK